jgi:hypothetical protein
MTKRSLFELLWFWNRFLSQGGFNVQCESLVVLDKSLYTLENLKINIRSMSETCKLITRLSPKSQMLTVEVVVL